MQTVYDWIVVGGGASGLFSAAYLSHYALKKGNAFRGAVFEKGKRVGAKLAVTGNGTCNISHTPLLPENYHGTDAAFSSYALQAFPPEKSMGFFQKIGVETFVREDGRVYPTCLQASAVLDCLRAELCQNGIEEHCGITVTSIKKQKNLWIVATDQGEFATKSVIVAAGGTAAPSVGGCDNGYRLLTALGCKCITPFPSVVPLKTDTAFIRAIKGIRVNAKVSLCHRDHVCASAYGEVLFTEYGLSGPAILQISRAVGAAKHEQSKSFQIRLDLFPQTKFDDLLKQLKARKDLLRERLLEDFFTGFINKRVGQTLVRACGLSLSSSVKQLTAEQIERLAKLCKCWNTDVYGTTGFSNAQVTGGGISTADFDPHTMEHRQLRGLYVIGEVLDIDGDCGGYNLQWAWSSAAVASEKILNNK